MLYKDGTKRKRKIGEPRKDQSIYSNLGHPFDIRDKLVEFIGKEEKSYCLTKGKRYRIIRANTIREASYFDETLSKRSGDDWQTKFQLTQGEDYFITIINDKNHKRQYSHLMFKMIHIPQTT